MMITALILASTAGQANFEVKPNSCITDLNYYRVMQQPFSAERPAHISKEPKYKNKPLYSSLMLGDESAKPVTLVLDESYETAEFYVDTNGNGDLTDDPAATMWRRQEQPEDRKPVVKIWLTYWYDAQVPVYYRGQVQTVGLKFYIYSKSDLERNKMEPVLLYYRDYYRKGKVTLGGQEYDVALVDDNTDGRYDSPANAELNFKGDTIFIDTNRSGKFEGAERFAMTQPFNVGGTTYEVARVAPNGSGVEIAKSESHVEKRVQVGDVAPDFGIWQGDPSKKGTLAALKGKVVLIDFWATWCGPCIKELPHVLEAYEKYKDKGFTIVSVSLDQPEDFAKMKKFIDENKMTWHHLHDADSKVQKRYNVSAIPATFLLNQKGEIVATGLRGEEMVEQIGKLLP